MGEKRSGGLTYKPPVLEIEGKKYPLRRLGILDMERLLRIVVKATKSMDRVSLDAVIAQRRTKQSEESDDITEPSPAMWAGFISDFLPQCFDEIIAFLASVIGLEPGYPEGTKKKHKDGSDPNEGTIRDPEVFPISALPMLVEKLTEHRNVVDFFAGNKGMLSGLTKLFGASNKLSTKSNDATGGPTSTSSDDD